MDGQARMVWRGVVFSSACGHPEQLVYLEKLVGKEFSDAVVRVDRISSVTLRMRSQ